MLTASTYHCRTKMNALTECSILVICIVIANTTANILTDGNLPNGDYGNDDGELRQQLEQTKNLVASLQTQIQILESHQGEMKQLLDAYQRELHDQKYELVKLVHASPMRRKDDDLDRAIHNISKREILSDTYPINNKAELLNLLLQSGVTGPPGRDGKDEKAGRDGEAGRDGTDGKDGIDGYPGRDGDNGKDGVDGANGHNGLDGDPGPPGPPGPSGPLGPAGPTGFPGINGTVGPQGRRGPPGADGEVGKDGVDGANGHNALDGAPGPRGSSGSPGPAGPTGVAGNDGAVGRQGPQGLPGADNTADVNAGAVYTRWGKTNCPSHSTLVYKGFAGSSNSDTTGGGTNYQCLPTDPEYNKYSGTSWIGTWLSGTEYQSYHYGVFPQSAHNQNVPCARCYTRNRAALMMIPGKRTCPDNWTKEYEGYLMAEAGHHRHSSTFECVDSNPEYITGLSGYQSGATFYFVKTDCTAQHTTGHCPPYYENRELTCVICTQ